MSVMCQAEECQIKLETNTTSISIKSQVWLIEDHGTHIGIGFDKDRRFNQHNRFPRQLCFVGVVHSCNKRLVEVVDVEGDGLTVLFIVYERMVSEGSVWDVAAEWVPLLSKAQLWTVAPADSHTTVISRSETYK